MQPPDAFMMPDPHQPPSKHLSRNWQGAWERTPGRIAGTMFVRLYQITFSPLIGGNCRHIPTCSEYAYEAIARHGLLSGGWLGLKRIARCGPFGRAGLDPVPVECRDRFHGHH